MSTVGWNCFNALPEDIQRQARQKCRVKPWSKALWLVCLFARSLVWAADNCEVCGEPLGDSFYFCTDKVEQTRKQVCVRCSGLTTICYLCGMPAFRDFTQLPDGRVICKRDVQSVVLDPAEALRVCDDVMDSLNRQFSRFTTFPRTNVTVDLMDRVRLQEMFKIAGRDLACPNVWGCTTRRTTDGQPAGFRINLLSALPRPLLQATCVHEFTHVWVFETVPAARRERIHDDATEGFCELVSYLAMQARQETAAVQDIKDNFYTRGQIALFIAAEQRFGFNEVVEWMRFGEDERLREDDLGRIRRVILPQRTNAVVPVPVAVRSPASQPAPETLVLQGILWNPASPLAIINGQTFGPGEEGKVRVSGTNLLIRCLTIKPDVVVVKVAAFKEPQELRLPQK